MKEIYQQTVEEVFERVNGKKSGLTSEQVKRSEKSVGGMNLQKERRKVSCRFSLKELSHSTHHFGFSFWGSIRQILCHHRQDCKRCSLHSQYGQPHAPNR